MSPTLALILALLATHTGLKVEIEVDKDKVKRMQEREHYLHQEMTRLLQEIEKNSCSMENLFQCVLQEQWLFWITAAALVLVLLTAGCRLIRRRKRGCGTCREQDRSKQKVGSEKTSSTVKVNSEEKQFLPSMELLKKLVDDLLGVCRVLSKKNCMPELYAAPGTDTTIEDWSTQKRSTTYRLLVILQPRPGHSFSLDTTEQPQARRIRVALDCLRPGEQLPETICFLHTSAGQRPREQGSHLLDTLCTGCFLDLEKVICWVQMLVVSAWQLLPQSLHCQLTALPSEKCCKFQLSSPSGMQSTIEMALAVQPGSSGAYLSLE